MGLGAMSPETENFFVTGVADFRISFNTTGRSVRIFWRGNFQLLGKSPPQKKECLDKIKTLTTTVTHCNQRCIVVTISK